MTQHTLYLTAAKWVGAIIIVAVFNLGPDVIVSLVGAP